MMPQLIIKDLDYSAKQHVKYGAGDGNRTRVASLEDWDSTIELRPRVPPDLRGLGSLTDGPGALRLPVGFLRPPTSPCTARPPVLSHTR